ncbi:MAG: MFS transporter [Bacteroidales bacterium]|nr:MFS transporter [Bacteroidales bacterium]
MGKMFHKTGLATVLTCFFVAASMDLTGIAVNYIKAGLSLSDSAAGVIPSMMFVWFLLISVPSGIALDRFGYRKVLVASLCVLGVGMSAMIPGRSFLSFLLAIGVMGIGNTMLSVALNPSVAVLVPENRLASSLTAGGFIKAAAGLIAPLLAAWGAAHAPGCLGWKLPYAVYLAVLLVSVVLLAGGGRERTLDAGSGSGTSPAGALALLRRPAILASFAAIVCHVGSDTCINIIAPQLLVRRAGFTLDQAVTASSLYFFCRLAGSLAGIYALRAVRVRPALLLSFGLLAAGLAGAFLAVSPAAIYVCVALLGLGNANAFVLILTRAMLLEPVRRNGISALMTMGVAGGAVFPPLMGLASDLLGLEAAVAVIALCVACVGFYAFARFRSCPSAASGN